MPKKSKKQKKSKIVKEFVESKFKEVKKEAEKDEEEQEEQIQDEEFFLEDTGTRTAPVLPDANNPLPALEDTAESAPRREENTSQDTSLYSDYSASSSYAKDTNYDNPEQRVEIIRPAGMDDERIHRMLPRQNAWQNERLPEQSAWQTQDVWNLERHEERKYEAIDKKAKEETEKISIQRRKRLRF
ncbi:hypothetical protein FJZ19_05325 [Candidatus Pacearchaeota archaeon]|nr:hypothetical protein [Candidatus Pacearchaeota archaeon]